MPDRKRRLTAVSLVTSTVVLGWLAAVHGVTAFATPGLNFVGETLARTHFDEILINSPANDGHRVKLQVKDPSDVYVVRNTVPPGGHSGWHTHPGPSVVSVTAGVATVYDGDDPNCTARTYPAGTGFVDAGGSHVHLVKNEGTETLVTVAFQILPAGAERRVDAPDPGFCSF